MKEDIISLINKLEDQIKDIQTPIEGWFGVSEYGKGKIAGFNYIIKELEDIIKNY